MQEVWGAIRVGADTYLRKQFKSVHTSHLCSYDCTFCFRFYCAAYTRGF